MSEKTVYEMTDEQIEALVGLTEHELDQRGLDWIDVYPVMEMDDERGVETLRDVYDIHSQETVVEHIQGSHIILDEGRDVARIAPPIEPGETRDAVNTAYWKGGREELDLGTQRFVEDAVQRGTEEEWEDLWDWADDKGQVAEEFFRQLCTLPTEPEDWFPSLGKTWDEYLED